MRKVCPSTYTSWNRCVKRGRVMARKRRRQIFNWNAFNMSGIIPWHVEREPMISGRDILIVRALVYRLSICYTPICADQIFINWPLVRQTTVNITREIRDFFSRDIPLPARCQDLIRCCISGCLLRNVWPYKIREYSTHREKGLLKKREYRS